MEAYGYKIGRNIGKRQKSHQNILDYQRKMKIY